MNQSLSNMRPAPPGDDELDLINSIFPLDDSALEKLGSFHALLVKWQAKTNLIASSTLDGFWSRHVADSLQVLALGNKIGTKHKWVKTQWADLGSGGGFPGMVIGIVLGVMEGNGAGDSDGAGKTCPVSLIEANAKKCAFLRQAVRHCDALAKVYHQRIEADLAPIMKSNLVTARALAPLPKLLDLVGGYLCDGRIGLFPKGQDYLEEIEECRGDWQFDLLVHQSRVETGSVILQLENLLRRSSAPDERIKDK